MCSRGSRAAHIRCRGDPPRVLACLSRATFHARGHPSLSTTSHLMPLPETLAACGLSRPPVHVLCIRLPYGRRLEMPEEPALELEVERIDLGRKSSASLGPSAHTQTTSTRRVHLDHRISVSNDAQGRPRSGAGRHANATASAPAARRGLAPPPSAAAPDAPLRLVSEDKTPQSSGTGRRREPGRRRRADGVRPGTRQDPSRSRFEED